ncbi:rhodanese-like domain-containing protein [Pseudonocardia bannensis]|uniref:rhodanese-like domain-containing protein n=1 Tax=Pseudonocardia bannensis TaxID=630973 RepID=UPI0028AFCF9F|nr:rhodanese-like domain-containing protein [Pseudonocardia bannensis]
MRNGGELAPGTIEGALHIPLAELPRRLVEVPRQRPAVTYCASGYRSSGAAAILRKEGWADVSDLLGGYAAWASLAPQSVG